MLFLLLLIWHTRLCTTWRLLSPVPLLLIISYSRMSSFSNFNIVCCMQAEANSISSGIFSLWYFLLILTSHHRIFTHLAGFPAFPSAPHVLVCIFNTPCINALYENLFSSLSLLLDMISWSLGCVIFIAVSPTLSVYLTITAKLAKFQR